MIRFTIVWIALIPFVGMSPAVHAACLVNDGDFTTADGGCKDLNTGLVWSPDLRAFTGGPGSSPGLSGSFDGWCNQELNSKPANGGGFTDWRSPTVGEVNEALANGLYSHLDFFLDGTPDDSVYRWTTCTTKVKGTLHRYKVRYSDGNVVLHNLSGSSDGNFVVCVRGLPADIANDCPAGPGKKKNRSGATSALSQMSTGALLLLPLAAVLATRCLKARRP
jgi:hypothetical protein